MSRYTEIKGCIHIHFPLKKLEREIELLGKAGERAGADFIVINSHTPKKYPLKYGKTFRREGYYHNTLVITAEETDDRQRQNHLLVIGGERWHGNKDTTEDVLSEINRHNTVSFAAHPDGFHKLYVVKKEHFWNNWDTDSFTGIEVWSMLFDWAKHTRTYNLPARYLGFPANLQGPSQNVRSIWDRVSLTRKVVGISGLDIHYLPFLFRLLDINKSFQYYSVFKCLRNHLLITKPLTGVPAQDKQVIIDTLRRGSLFFANDLIADSSGFFFGTHNGEKTMGDTVLTGTDLIVQSPVKASMRIIHNGRTISEEDTTQKKWAPESAGIYRVEIALKGNPWIFSNHMRVENA